MIIQRDLLSTIKPFLDKKWFISITGPRQSGKTTFLGILNTYLTEELKIIKGNLQNKGIRI